jgi:chloramphenicol O-acetyltransferase type A
MQILFINITKSQEEKEGFSLSIPKYLQEWEENSTFAVELPLLPYMKTEILPQESSRAEAFDLWMSSPVPMVTFIKTLNVSRLVKISKRRDMKFNMLMCWCIGKAASEIEEFNTLPVGKKLFHYDELAVNVIVKNCEGGIDSCDVPLMEDLSQFNQQYLQLTKQAAESCTSTAMENSMVIGTSAMIQTELDGIVNQYSGLFNNPFLAWGKYKRRLFKTKLPVSLQFHHVQMDGAQAALFLEKVQQEIDELPF